MDTIDNKTYEVLTYSISVCGAADERNNPLISPIAISALLSTLDDIEKKKWRFLFKKFWKKFKGSHFERNSKISLKWENEHEIFFLLQNHYFHKKAYKKRLKNTHIKIKLINFSRSYDWLNNGAGLKTSKILSHSTEKVEKV